MAKCKIETIPGRNRIIENIFHAILQRDCFLVMGHKNPDEDCISSMIAVSLLLNKFSKKAYILIPTKINRNFQYLLNICRYNSIGILDNKQELPCDISTIFIMDTPKPEMRESFPGSEAFFAGSDVLKIEIDHHLEADSEYSGDEGYRLVDEASSASELVGLMAFKMRNRPDLLGTLNAQDLFSRNFVLAVLTGIIGDSKMGKYLKTSKERWFYRLFSGMFDEMLTSKTRKDSRNFSTMDEVFTELQHLSKEEDECFSLLMKEKVRLSPKIGTILADKKVMEKIRKKYSHDTIVTVARYAADVLAESSSFLSLIAYFDDPENSDLIQFRMRRSQGYTRLDLREIITTFGIKNGGGHPGAIGFRIPEKEIPDLRTYMETLVAGTERLIANR